MIEMMQKYTKEDEQVTIISSMIPGTYPALTYAKKENLLPFLQFLLLYVNIDSGKEISDVERYFIKRLKQQISNDKNKLIFVERKKDPYDNECRIGFLEKYFNEQNLKKDFLKNYVFLNRIIVSKISEKKVSFFNEGDDQKPSTSPEFIEHDVEIYIRK
jgi:hypothetical protein